MIQFLQDCFWVGLILVGIRFGLKHRRNIEAIRPPKDSWKQGHKLRRVSKQELRREQQRVINDKTRTGGYVTNHGRRRRLPGMITPPRELDDNDLAELDGMFGDAGTNPADYDK